MIYTHYRDAYWSPQRWPNFKAQELSCRHCGQYYHDERALDALQAIRSTMNCPLHINSAHRCYVHNRAVGGVPSSMHRQIAFDISVTGIDHKQIYHLARLVGFTGFGFYKHFIHVDMGVRRSWMTKKGEQIWRD